MTKPPFPHVWDSTMIGTLRSCARKLELQYVHHWKPQTESVHLVAGGAFASGLEAARRAFYEQGLSPSESVATCAVRSRCPSGSVWVSWPARYAVSVPALGRSLLVWP